MRKSIAGLVLMAILPASPLPAAIVSIDEVGLGGDTPAIIAQSFGEDVLTFSDRTHEHNGAAFNEGGTLSTSGTTIVPLPTYLLGQDYIRFANDARENVDYAATITTDEPSNFWLLVDNRLDGPAGTTGGGQTTDPVLGGTLQWIIDGGWERVNTGISPNGQPDYTGVDESGADAGTVGPGVGLNQFYSVFTLPDRRTSVTVHSNGIGGSNMISLVAGIPFVPGDFNNDGLINEVDFGILNDNLGEGIFGNPVGTTEGDMNFDGRVDLDDFGQFKELFPAAFAQAQAIPEPSTLALLGGIVLLLSLGRLRKAVG